MAQGINLLPELTEREARKEVYKRKVNIVSIAVLLSVAVILVGLFAYQLFLQTSRSRAERESENLENQILDQKEKEIAQLALVDKLNQIDKLLNEGVPTASAVATVSDLASGSGGVSITSFKIKSDGDVLLAGTARNSRTLEKFFESLISKNIKATFDNIILINLSGERGKPYDFSIDMDFKPKGIIER